MLASKAPLAKVYQLKSISGTKPKMPLEFSSNIGGQDLLDSLAHEYSKSKKPIEVNFREYTFVSSQGRRTHLIHPYPAKLLAKIPQFFLRCEKLVPPGSTLLDPFCGSGTVLFEGQLAGLTTVGADSNPLARLITSAKLVKIDTAIALSELQNIMQAIPFVKADIPDVVNRSHWYSERISNELGCLRSAISDNSSLAHRSFFDACFSATCRRVSYADPRLSVPVKINPDRSLKYGAKGDEVIQKLKRLETLDATSVFWSVATQNIKRKSETEETFPLRSAKFKVLDNAMQLDLPDSSIDVVITSPPYVGAQKYVRASSLSLGWLGLTPDAALRQYEKVSIGREHLMKEEVWTDEAIVPTADNVIKRVKKVNPLRARIAQWYLLEMRQAINEIHRVLRKDGRLVLVAGPNMVAGQYFDTPSYLKRLTEDTGMQTDVHMLDTIESRGLMTKRNRTAGMIQQESVMVFTKKN